LEKTYFLKKKLIINHEYGQLGNILFRLSNTLAYVLEHGYQVEDYTLAFCNYHDGSSNIRFFENYFQFHFFEYPRPKSLLINRIKWKLRDKNYRKIKVIENFDPSYDLSILNPASSYQLKGFHFTAGELIVKHRRQICQILDFRSSLKSPIDSLVKKAKIKYEVLLGVHIRENDFRDFYEGRYFVPVNCFLNLIDKFQKLNKGKSTGVIVCSDSPKILQEIKGRLPSIIIPQGSVAQDIYALSQCDYLIGPQATTFSSWSAYFGNTPLYQVTKDSRLKSLNIFKTVSRLEPFSPFST
tara:strand:- start:6583 stop:7473 length:891 start_codon:yes stop_codon:yes gene_type:complete